MKFRLPRFFFGLFMMGVIHGVAGENRTIFLQGHVTKASFRINSDYYKGLDVLLPDSRWHEMDRYYLGTNNTVRPIYGKIDIEQAMDPKRSPDEELASCLKDLREPYIHPAGQITKILNTSSGKFPILAFTGTGGNMTFITLYLKNKYRVNICFSEDAPVYYRSKEGFTRLVEEIGGSFELK